MRRLRHAGPTSKHPGCDGHPFQHQVVERARRSGALKPDPPRRAQIRLGGDPIGRSREGDTVRPESRPAAVGRLPPRRALGQPCGRPHQRRGVERTAAEQRLEVGDHPQCGGRVRVHR